MKNTINQTRPKTWAVYAALGATVLLWASPAPAQTIYRVLGPDGKVTFSDKPPAASDKATAAGVVTTSAETAGPALPYELRQVANNYPVTLYTANNCVPCGAGRAMLSSRGVPFSEKTVNTAEDAAALQRLSGDNSLPFLTISVATPVPTRAATGPRAP